MFRTTVRTGFLIRTLQGSSIIVPTRDIKRWVAPTLRELRRRGKLLGPQPVQKRSEFLEWNYRSELFSFSKRLHENFQIPLLQTAFTQLSYIQQEQKKQAELGVKDAGLEMTDNEKLAEKGAYLAQEYVNAFLQHALPKVPAEGIKAISDNLISVETLSHIASNLGMKDLILSAEYPPTKETFAKSLLAVIGALEESSNVQRAFLFIRDFICTQLNQRDLLELWQIEQPEQLLQKVCNAQNLGEPEPRLLGDCGKNTVLAAYHVGIYANKRMIGSGYGEDIATAIHTASINALQLLFGMTDYMRPFDFQLQVEPKLVKLTQN